MRAFEFPVETVKDVVVNCYFSAVSTGIDKSGYTSSFALTTPTVYKINYYDNYQFVQLPDFVGKTPFHNGAGKANATSLPTGSATTIFTDLYFSNCYVEKVELNIKSKI